MKRGLKRANTITKHANGKRNYDRIFLYSVGRMKLASETGGDNCYHKGGHAGEQWEQNKSKRNERTLRSADDSATHENPNGEKKGAESDGKRQMPGSSQR